MSNPFTRQAISNHNTKNYSVEDVKKSNARFYEKNPWSYRASSYD